MGRARLEAFSDGVFAIIITIMVIELKPPHDPTWPALFEKWPVLLSYLLSFVYVGIYWGNHHHLMHSLQHATPGVIWGNLHLLFWLSLVPFVTDWLGETRAENVPAAAYGLVMLFCALAYLALQATIARQQTENTGRYAHDRNRRKAIFSMFAYAAAVFSSFAAPVLSIALYVLVALLWLVPERAFEKIGE